MIWRCDLAVHWPRKDGRKPRVFLVGQGDDPTEAARGCKTFLEVLKIAVRR